MSFDDDASLSSRKAAAAVSFFSARAADPLTCSRRPAPRLAMVWNEACQREKDGRKKQNEKLSIKESFRRSSALLSLCLSRSA
jgi:hypothetical protein